MTPIGSLDPLLPVLFSDLFTDGAGAADAAGVATVVAVGAGVDACCGD